AGAQRLGRERRATGEGNAAADDAIGAQHALLDIGDVHRAALAFAEAGRLAHQLRHHPVDVHALGDAVPVAPVRGGDVVAVRELGANPYRDGFLTRVEVDKPGHEPGGEVLSGQVLEGPDLDHSLVHIEQLLAAESGACRDNV